VWYTDRMPRKRVQNCISCGANDWYETPSGSRRCRACAKKRANKNQDRTREAHSKREYARRNPGIRHVYRPYGPRGLKFSADEVLRRKRVSNRLRKTAPGKCSIQQFMLRVEMFGGKCYMCGKSWEVIEHVIPLSRNGTNWPANLRPACSKCNNRKHNKDWRLFV
jgi:5-methylcytosine-specific restriction endonuclease McrA